MIDNSFRSILPRYVNPLIKIYKFLGLSPNFITILGCLTGLASALAAKNNFFLLALTLWWLGRIFDGTDGIYARSINQSTNLGAFLDINCDMLVYGTMILAFSKIWPSMQAYWLIIIFLYVLCISGALSLGNLRSMQSLNVSDNRKLKLAAGLAEAGETGIYYSSCLIFPAYVKTLSFIWIIILAITIVARSVIAYRIFKK